MNLDMKELDKILASLFKKKFISLETKGKDTKTTLEPLRNKLYSDFENFLSREKKIKSTNEFKEMLNRIIQLYENSLEHDLSPVEISQIKDWINFGYSEEMLANAIKDAVNKNKKTVSDIEW